MGQLVQEAFIKAQFLAEGDEFGGAVASSEDTLVVGSLFEAGGSRGVNGNERDRSRPESGAVFVFVRQGGQWVRQAYLKASNADIRDRFGAEVAIDRDTIAVLARGESSAALGINGNQNDNSLSSAAGGIANLAATPHGAIYVFTRTNGVWTQQAYIKPPDRETFFHNLSLSGDCIVTGKHVLVREDGLWRYHSKVEPTTSEGTIGKVVRSFIRGDTIVSTGFEAPANRPLDPASRRDPRFASRYLGYVFVKKGEGWVQEARLPLLGNEQPLAIRICCNGAQDTIAFAMAGTYFDAEFKMLQGFGGYSAKVPQPHYRGTVFVFHREGAGGEWKQAATLMGRVMPPGANFGAFGNAMAMEENHLLVGDPFDCSGGVGFNPSETKNAPFVTGTVYLFALVDGQWTRTGILKPHREMRAGLGSSLAISGSTVVCGAFRESSDARGD